MERPPKRQQQGDHRDLRDRHHRAGDARGTLHAELNGKRADAHPLVAFNGLEVIERHDAVGADRIEQRQKEDRPGGNAAQQRGRTGEPWQPFIAEADRRIAPPAIGLEAEWRRTIGPGGGEPEHARPKHHRPDERRHGKRQATPGNGDPQPPVTGHAAGGDGPVRLVDGIDMAVVPVVHRLAGAADQGARQGDAGQQKQPIRTDGGAGRHNPAAEGPHGRKPGNRLQQLKHRARFGNGRRIPG